MSAENAELLRRAVEAYNRRDIEALVAELDPEVEWHPALPGPLEGAATIYRGHDGIAEMFRDFCEVLDGKGVRIRGYLDPEEALEAARLDE